MIPDEAVEAAAAKLPAIWSSSPVYRDNLRAALEAAAPHIAAEVERELTDAKRVIALLVGEAGGKVAISRRAIAELSDATILETTQDVINGGWIIRTRIPDA